MKKITLFFLFCFSVSYSFAQTTLYVEGPTFGPFVDISVLPGAVTVPLACDDCNATGIPLGFIFYFCGIGYPTISASSNGFISLSNTSLVPYVNSAANITGMGMIMPFWDNLNGAPIAGSGTVPSAYCSTTGTAPNRVFTFEWKDFNANTTCKSCIADFEVRLYETSNMIQFAYGTSYYTGMSATMGIANSTTDWQSLNDPSSYPIPSSSVFTSSVTAMPAKNQIYKWFAPCEGTPDAGALSATITTGCADYHTFLSLTDATSSQGGIMRTWQTSTDGVVWTDMPSIMSDTCTVLVTKTSYYRCKTTCSNTGLSAYTAPILASLKVLSPISGPDALCAGNSFTYTDTLTGGAWTSSSLPVATIGPAGSVSALTAGSVILKYSYMTCNVVKTVIVNKCKDGVNGLAKNEDMLEVFPNPNKGTFSINLHTANEEPVTVVIANITGAIQYTTTILTNNNVEMKQQLPPGIYILSAVSLHENYKAKLVIE